MVDMTNLLHVDASEAKAPQDPPDGVYDCVVKQWKPPVESPFDPEKRRLTFELRPLRWPSELNGSEPDFDVTKRTFFKHFEFDPRRVDSYFYLNLFVTQACHVPVEVNGRRRMLDERIAETIGQEVQIAKVTRRYKAKDGSEKEATDYRMVIDGQTIFERRDD